MLRKFVLEDKVLREKEEIKTFQQNMRDLQKQLVDAFRKEY